MKRLKDFILKHKRLLIRITVSLTYCLIVVWFLGLLSRYNQDRSIEKTFQWFLKSPLLILLNTSIIIWLLLFWAVILGRWWRGFLGTSVLVLVFAVVNYFKQTIRGEPFYPSDLILTGEATNILKATKLTPSLGLIFFGISLMIAVAGLRFLFKKTKPTLKLRLAVGGFLLLSAPVSYQGFLSNSTNQKRIGVEDAIWNQNQNYKQNGSLLAFLMQAQYINVKKPKDYNQKLAEQILEKNKPNKSFSGNQPNIIMVMSESFWDPVRLPEVEFNLDPLEKVRELQKESLYGNLLVRTFGGNTANTEFETLTGFSMNFLPGGVAYQQYLKQPVPSVVSLLKEQGYWLEAIHPYEAWFWNRQEVYPKKLGFNTFLSLDDFSNKQKKGEYVADEAVVGKIIERYQKHREKNSQQKFFAHVVTMQNHGWYNQGRYKDGQLVKTSSAILSEEALAEIDVYSQGVKDASDSLAQLVEYFRGQEEPTIIVFYGDHLPTLGTNFSYYRQTGYVSKEDLSDEDSLKLYQTPFLIWSNTQSKGQDLGSIRANFLFPTIIEEFNLKSSSFFELLRKTPDSAKNCAIKCWSEEGFVEAGNYSDIFQKQATAQYYYLFDKNSNFIQSYDTIKQ